MRIRSNNQKEIKKKKKFLCRYLIRASQTYLNYLCRLYVTHSIYAEKQTKKKVDSFTSRDLCPVAIYSGHDPA